MLDFIKAQATPAQKAEQENAVALAQKNADLIEYIAMMADVDIPSEEGEVNE